MKRKKIFRDIAGKLSAHSIPKMKSCKDKLFCRIFCALLVNKVNKYR